jgi:hypothetical protein
MVQFKRDLPLPGDREPDNTYWTIGGTAAQTELTRSSYRDYRPRPLTGKDLVAYNDGKERGLVYYGACTTKELWGFIRARGIIVGPKGNVRKPGLIATLEQADEDVKFTRFFNLPPELRNDIYEQYFEALGVLPQLPHQPPLLLASSAVRNEASLLYHQQSTFTFGFVTNCRTLDILQGRRLQPLRTGVHKDTVGLMNRMLNTDFTSIKHFRLQVWKPELDVGSTIVSFATWIADLSGSVTPVITSEKQDYRATPWVPLFESVGQALERALGEIRARPGVHKLSAADIAALRDVVHHAMI